MATTKLKIEFSDKEYKALTQICKEKHTAKDKFIKKCIRDMIQVYAENKRIVPQKYKLYTEEETKKLDADLDQYFKQELADSLKASGIIGGKLI